MTTKRTAPVQIRVTSRRATVKIDNHTVFDGWLAVVIIAIILAVRLTAAIAKLIWCLLAWLLPILFRLSLVAAARLYVAVQALYRAS